MHTFEAILTCEKKRVNIEPCSKGRHTDSASRTYTMDSKVADKDITPATIMVADVSFCPVPPEDMTPLVKSSVDSSRKKQYEGQGCALKDRHLRSVLACGRRVAWHVRAAVHARRRSSDDGGANVHSTLAA